MGYNLQGIKHKKNEHPNNKTQTKIAIQISGKIQGKVQKD